MQNEAEQKPTPEADSAATCDDTEDQEDQEDDQDDHALNGKDNGDTAMDLVTKEHLEQLADALKDDWSKLAAELNFPDDDVAFFASEIDDKKAQALKMLTIWRVSELFEVDFFLVS